MQFILTIIAMARTFVTSFESKVSDRDFNTIGRKLTELSDDQEFISEVKKLGEKFAGKTSEAQANLMDGQLNLAVVMGLYKAQLDNFEEIVLEISSNKVIMSRIRKLMRLKAFQNVGKAYLEASVSSTDKMNKAVKKLLAA